MLKLLLVELVDLVEVATGLALLLGVLLLFPGRCCGLRAWLAGDKAAKEVVSITLVALLLLGIVELLKPYIR